MKTPPLPPTRAGRLLEQLRSPDYPYPPLHEGRIKDAILSRYASLKHFFKRVGYVLATEKRESKEMYRIYRRALKGEATSQEIKTANKQVIDILKVLGIATAYLLPFGATALVLALEKLAQTQGMSIFPDSFHDFSL